MGCFAQPGGSAVSDAYVRTLSCAIQQSRCQWAGRIEHEALRALVARLGRAAAARTPVDHKKPRGSLLRGSNLTMAPLLRWLKSAPFKRYMQEVGAKFGMPDSNLDKNQGVFEHGLNSVGVARAAGVRGRNRPSDARLLS